MLGVSRDASDDEIKEAYREKAKEFHPDTSDREDAAEMFKKVKEAYEVAYSGDSEGFSSAYPGKDREKTDTKDKDTGGDGRESGRAQGDSDGFGKTGGWTRSGGVSGGTKEGTRTSTRGGRREGFYDNWEGRHEGGKNTGREGERRNSYKKEDEETEYGEEYEVHKEFGLGWKLGHAETGEWFVFTEGETAPYVDGKKILYLDLDGNISTEAVFFASKEAAEENYEEHYGSEDGFGYEHDKEESHRGFSHKGESYRRRTEERRDGFGEQGWGEKQKVGGFDGLWRLYYQEKHEDGRTRKRWGVTTDVTGDDRFVNPKGEYQQTEFWFDDRGEAVSAYKRYVERMKEARKGFESGEGGEDEAWGGTRQEEETLVFKIADMTVTFSEAVEDAFEPLKQHSLTIAVVLSVFFVAVAYMSEAVREILAAIWLPIYVGFATIAQTPHLIFFAAAYISIVIVLVVAKMTTRF